LGSPQECTTSNWKNYWEGHIKIYAVRVIDGNASLLKSCASNPSMYFDVQSASQLNAVFTSIAQNLANLRIARQEAAAVEMISILLKVERHRSIETKCLPQQMP
jgi:hypothetical protein